MRMGPLVPEAGPLLENRLLQANLPAPEDLPVPDDLRLPRLFRVSDS